MVNEIISGFKYLVVTGMATSVLFRDAILVRAMFSALMLGFRTLVS